MKYTGTLLPFQQNIVDQIIAKLKTTKQCCFTARIGYGKHHIILAIVSDLQLSASWTYGKYTLCAKQDYDEFNNIINKYTDVNDKLTRDYIKNDIHFIIDTFTLTVQVKNLLI